MIDKEQQNEDVESGSNINADIEPPEDDDEAEEGLFSSEKKIVRLLTVVLYLGAVSGGGLLLGLYYVIFWDPSAQLTESDQYSSGGRWRRAAGRVPGSQLDSHLKSFQAGQHHLTLLLDNVSVADVNWSHQSISKLESLIAGKVLEILERNYANSSADGNNSIASVGVVNHSSIEANGQERGRAGATTSSSDALGSEPSGF